MQEFITASLIFLYALMIGSFLNVCIYRIPIQENIARGRSYCPSCKAMIPWYRNIPLLSYISLRGRCEKCKAPIPVIYPLVEVLNALLWLGIWFKYGLTFYGLLSSIFVSLLLVIAFIDIKHRIIPNSILLIILAVGLFKAFYQTLLLDSPWSMWILGALVTSLPSYIISLIRPGSLGGGDIKLMAVAGLFLAWKLSLLSLLTATAYALIYSFLLLLGGKSIKKIQIPFGPFLTLGFLTSIFMGEKLILLYLDIFFGP